MFSLRNARLCGGAFLDLVAEVEVPGVSSLGLGIGVGGTRVGVGAKNNNLEKLINY